MTGSKSTASRLLSAFASGAIYEALSVAWVHQATHGNAIRTAIVSGLQATAMVVGIGESVHERRAGGAFVIGYACGAFIAMVCA
jgi:hypothetical protein